jgi:response regulator RpfG family c-di-GMP phosphodiesterase
MDLIMPDIDGFEATRQLRHLPELQDVLVIAVSASAFEQTRQESQEAGCHGFLAKPISEQMVFDILQTFLPLEWVYAPEQPSPPHVIPKPAAEDLPVNLSHAELLTFYQLALIGDIMGIRRKIQALERNDQALHPFTEKIRELASHLNIVEIQRFLKPYIERKIRNDE